MSDRTVTLWRSQVERVAWVRDDFARWYFWQRSVPYRLRAAGELQAEAVPVSAWCEVYTLGGRHLLWRGSLGAVPASCRSYNSEVRVFHDTSPLVR